MNAADSATQASTTPDQEGTEDPGPEASDPADDLPAPSEVPTDLRVAFWTLVFLLKFAIVATTLGVLFVVFEDNWDLGGPLLGLGALLFLFAVVRYRRYRQSSAAEAGSDSTG